MVGIILERMLSNYSIILIKHPIHTIKFLNTLILSAVLSFESEIAMAILFTIKLECYDKYLSFNILHL